MNTAKKLTGLILATAAAGLFATANVVSAAEEAKTTHCEGANACKGKSACKTATNACKGTNSCKGKGMEMMSKKDCDAAKSKMNEEKK